MAFRSGTTLDLRKYSSDQSDVVHGKIAADVTKTAAEAKKETRAIVSSFELIRHNNIDINTLFVTKVSS